MFELIFPIVLLSTMAALIFGLITKGDFLLYTRPVVYLLDGWGEIYKSRDLGGYCYVYPGFKIGVVYLRKDGTTGGTCYIKRWYKTKKEAIEGMLNCK
jgi:hypothetical protein